MILRYLILFGGIVLMITGCNSLVSQNFGTHRLRTIDVAEADAQAIGETDFVEVAGAVIGKVAVGDGKADAWGKWGVSRPLLSPDQHKAWENGATVETSLIGWFKSEYSRCSDNLKCLPFTGKRAIGLIGPPVDPATLTGQYLGTRIKLKEPLVYLHLGEKPMAWHWNLLFFLGGICLAFIPEAIRHNRKAANKSKA
jgi:hypothetical protein